MEMMQLSDNPRKALTWLPLGRRSVESPKQLGVNVEWLAEKERSKELR